MILYIALTFFLCLLVGFPVMVCLGLATYLPVLIFYPKYFMALTHTMINTMDSFPFMAIPLFILAGSIMVDIGITKAILDFSNILIGRLRGGLAHVNVLASMLFAGISGSAVADAAGLGSIEIPMMLEGGYDNEMSCAVTAASAIIGPIIPPSITAVTYALVYPNVSIIAIFMAGFIPGILLGLGCMIVNYYLAVKRDIPVIKEKFNILYALRVVYKSIPALLMPLIILGGILGGVFTPTEAAAVAVMYALIYGFFTKKIKVSRLSKIIIDTGITTSVTFLVFGIASGFNWILVNEGIPDIIIGTFKAFTTNPLVFLLLVNALFLIVGTVISTGPAVIIFVPLLAPVALSYGIDPLHFAVIVIVNLSFGMITPPVGTVLYVICNVGKIKISKLINTLKPFYLVEVLVLLVVTFSPFIILWLPRLLGVWKF